MSDAVDMTDEYDDGRIYFELDIEGSTPEVEIWLGDDAGHLVQKEIGVLRTSVVPGHYVVEFGLGMTCYPIELREHTRRTQREIEAGPSCPRPDVGLDDFEGA